MSAPLSGPLFSEEEVHKLQMAVATSLRVDVDTALASFPLTPYKFNLIEAMCRQVGDVDVELCDILREGAPTGIRQAIPASGVFPPVANEDDCSDADVDWSCASVWTITSLQGKNLCVCVAC